MDDRLTYPLPSRTALTAAIDTLVHVLDLMDGDPDLEPIDEREPDGDEADAAWIEWHTMRGAAKHGANACGWNEDDEDSDPPEDDDGGGDCTDDEPGFDPLSRHEANVLGRRIYGGGAGCAINGDRELNGDEGDYGGEVDGV
jgi:hypothetical protein